MIQFYNDQRDIVIDLTDDKLLATMTIKRENNCVNQQEILDLIEKANIKNGFISCVTSSKPKEINIPFPIAQIDAFPEEPTFELYFNNEEVYYSKLPLNEENVCNLVYLHKGSSLGRLNIANDLLVQKNVCGEYIYKIEGENNIIDKHRGKNVKFDYSTHEFIAEVNGYLTLDKDGNYSVSDHLEISHDIDENYGNIYLLGDLTIKGNVSNVKHIRAVGTLTIEGKVTNSNIYAENSVFVKGDITGCNNGGISSNGNITCHDIMRSKIFCGNKLEVYGDVKYSKLVGEEKLLVGPETSIVASELLSCKRIIVNNVRNEGDDVSTLEITVSPYTKEQLMLLTRELVYLSENNINVEKLPLIEEEIKLLEDRLSQKVEESIEIEFNNGASIETTGHIQRHVSLRILKDSHQVNDDDFRCKKINNLR
jgi:uncharacterized protein (DUF342 family)